MATVSQAGTFSMPVRRASSARAAVAGIAQIAAANIPGTMAAPMVFEHLHDCVRYNYAGIIWLNAVGVADGYFHDSNALRAMVPTYAEEFFGRREAEVVTPLPEALRSEYGPTPLSGKLRVSKAAFYRHDYYGTLMQPFNVYHGLRWVLRQNGLPVGMVMIGRPFGDGDLNAEELHSLGRLETDFARALALPSANRTQAEYAAHYGSIVCSEHARVLGVSGNAPWILGHWFDPCFTLEHGSPLPLLLADLVKQSAAHRAQADAAAPVISEHTPWGRFSARAEPLTLATAGHDSCLLHLVHHQPLDVALLKSIRELGLPPRQAQVCQHLASGMTEPQTAHALGLSSNTVTYYRRIIYTRLGIDQRKQLQARLLQAASSCGAHGVT